MPISKSCLSSPRIAVIGAGITGLSAAWYLRRQLPTADIQIFEASDRVGGKIGTRRIDGFLVETGPDSFVTYKPAALALIRELGLEDELVELQSVPQSVYVAKKGRNHPLPSGFRLTAPTNLRAFAKSPLISWPGKARILAEPLVRRRQRPDDESVAAFVRRRFGRECLETMASPLMAGIYQADANHLSLAATFPQLRKLEHDAGSVIVGMRRASKARPAGGSPFRSLRHGVQSLVDRLACELSNCLQTGAAVSSLEYCDNNWRLTVNDRIEVFDAVVCCLAPALAARIVTDPELQPALAQLTTVATATVSLGFRRADVQDLPTLDAYGLLVPEHEGGSIRSCTWCTNKLPGRSADDDFLVRAFPRPEALQSSPNDAELIAAVRADLQRLIGLRAEPTMTYVQRLTHGTPVYEVGHLERVARIEALADTVPGIAFCGCGYRGVGLPDCIAQAKTAATSIVDAITRPLTAEACS